MTTTIGISLLVMALFVDTDAGFWVAFCGGALLAM